MLTETKGSKLNSLYSTLPSFTPAHRLTAKLLTLLVPVFILAGCDSAGSNEQAPASTLIMNAMIIDGSGSPAYSAALRVEGDEIAEIGELAARPGETVIDANGLFLAPGFIDTHSHHDRGLAENKDALPMLTQGITTTIFGQDGGHFFPIADFYDAYEQAPAAVNVGSYVGHNTIREIVMAARSEEPATDDEIEAMASLLAEELNSGALGFSSGLEYVPGKFSEGSEVVRLAQRAAALGARYASHVRSEDRFVFEAIEEIIQIGRLTGMPVHYSHMKLAARQVWGEAPRVLEMLNMARADGVEITGDIYPYEYWQSTITVLLPSRDPRDMDEINFVLESIAPADGIIFTDFMPDPSYVGLSIADIAELRSNSEAQTLSDVIAESMAWSEANGGQASESIMGRSMHEDDIEQLLQWEFANICSDGGYTGHPRGYGAFPRVLARYVRDRNTLALETAVAMMSSRAASAMGLTNRGLLQAGMKADLVLFDPETIQDHATVEDTQQFSSGVQSVWVNGELVLEDSQATEARPGQALRRSEF